ncbi:MAG: ribose-5-phosphate isomerase A, partial [Nitrososphaeraceae archaeon]|nr:ribose-5-phosphate isomerase A [Nitrososphaeraceae archaeon]
KFSEAGFKPELRKRNNRKYISDDGNYIVDLNLGSISNPEQLHTKLKQFTGVVEIGLFLNIADIVIVGKKDECEIIERKK